MKFPSKCPHCAKDIVDLPLDAHYFPTQLKLGVAAEIHKCMHCKKPLYVFRGYAHDKENNTKSTTEDSVMCYIPKTRKVNFPASVKSLSPKCYKIYLESFRARENKYNTLAAAGLRIALERLLWDYLIKIQSYTESELEGKTLGKIIPKLEEQIKHRTYIRMIKYFGDKTIHVTNAPNFTLKECFSTFDLFLQELDLVLNDKRLEEKLTYITDKKANI